MKTYSALSFLDSAATALSATSGPTPVTSPIAMPMRIVGRRDRHMAGRLEKADERLLLERFNPALLDFLLLLRAQRRFDRSPHVVQRLYMRRTFVFQAQDVTIIVGLNDLADLAGLERSRRFCQLRAQHGPLNPVVSLLLRVLRIKGSQLLERSPLL